MRADSSASGADFPPITPQKGPGDKAPPVSKQGYPDDRKEADDRKECSSNGKPAIALPQLAGTRKEPETPKGTRASPNASTTASSNASSNEELEGSRVLANSSAATSRQLVEEAIYKGENCSVSVCGTSLKIFSLEGEQLASIPVYGVVARFEQDRRRVVCSLLDWEFFMLSDVSDSVEKSWKLEMTWSQALSFRKQIEKLGIVQTDLSGQFKFKKYIGKGAFSEVYLAQHAETKTNVAAKVMKKPLGYPDVNVDTHVWDEFSKEVQVLAAAQGHENIMKLHSTYLFRTNDEATHGEGPCALAMITECLEICLLDLIKKYTKLPESSTKGVAESLLRAVGHLNSVGLAHRDIKVSNVMIRSMERGGVVLVDYGFGRAIGEPEVFKSVVGTVGYLAPELFIENTPVDLRYTDVFSIGIVTMTCLIGRSVFQGRCKDGMATDRAKYFENQRCELDWVTPKAILTPVGFETLRATLELDPSNRPHAAAALRSQWYDLKYEDCVPSDLPEFRERELAYMTAPRHRRSSLCDAAPLESKPAGRKPTPPSEAGSGEAAKSDVSGALKPTPPPSSAPDRRRRSPPGRRREPPPTSSSSGGMSPAAACAA